MADRLSISEDPVGRDKRMIGGIPVNELHYPYVISMFNQMNSLLCGGTIITPRIILTAAHCVDTKPTHVRTSTNDMKYKIIKTFAHEEFDRNSLIHDIGLLLLDNKIQDATTVSLQQYTHSVPIGTMAYALGWGMTEHGSFSRNLRFIEVPIVPEQKCAQTFGRIGFWVCTDAQHWGTCIGDSGGPLMMNGVQIGITSFGKGSVWNPCELGESAVFTRVSTYYDWIKKKIDIAEK
ncbi:hypothetical protein QAD02_004515 [Eretmocerus hayati]|uniref:Uncharacterized protein n=1 Tax=Eretmocerus hayati TaxID=131215 RepID=A0ACC2NPY6_9HYME|nr:hypothetical protein QAD02_004515 [Eretmocerus hayati]